MVLGKLPVPGRPTIWITVGQGPTALTVGAGGGCLDIFNLIYGHLSDESPVEGPPIPITIDMVQKAISQMKAGKAPSHQV